MKAFALRFLVAAVLAASLSCAYAAETFKVAFIGALSGPFALQSEETLKNISAAVDLVNSRGGILGGTSIEIVPFDNKGNPQETLIVLQKAIDQDIRYVISGVSNIAHAVTEAVGKYNARNPDRSVLFLDYGALDPALTEAKCSFWHFRFEAHADMQVNVLTDYMKQRASIQKVYLINQDYAYGQAVSRASKEMLMAKRPDIQIVGDELIPLGKVKDFAPYVTKIRGSGADSVLTGNWGNDLSLLIKASNESGLTATYYTLLAAYFGTPTGIAVSRADRVETLYAWTINAADATWEKRLLNYKAKYNSISNLDYLPAFRVVEMLASAMQQAGTSDPIKVAYALEGMKYAGPSGDSWMRAEDHQMIAPIYVLGFAKAGQPGVKHDAEGTGYGWKTDALIEAKNTVPAVKCQMERPPR
jgi:branched-chain amino acid transport system substrate-binding protein